MVRRAQHPHRLLAQHDARQHTHVVGGGDERGVQVAIAQPGQQLVRARLGERDLHARVAAVEAFEQ
jgi:hypothetical protein